MSHRGICLVAFATAVLSKQAVQQTDCKGITADNDAYCAQVGAECYDDNVNEDGADWGCFCAIDPYQRGPMAHPPISCLLPLPDVLVGAVSGDTIEDGHTATFTVKLDGLKPTLDVVIVLVSSNVQEGTVAPAALTFDGTSWDVDQVVTVTGVDDSVVDGDVTFTIGFDASGSADPDYALVTVPEVAVKNIDDDTPHVVMSAVSADTNEGGTTATFGVHLATDPAAAVTMTFESSRDDEVTVSPTTVTFQSGDDSFSREVALTLTGQDDAMIDGDQEVVISYAITGDAEYSALIPHDLTVTNVDDDQAHVVMHSATGDTHESDEHTGHTVFITMELSLLPDDDVTVFLSSSNEAEGKIFPPFLIFGAADWNMPHTVTVTGQDDNLLDGDQVFTVITSSPTSVGDTNYPGIDVEDVTIMNVDDDTPHVVIHPITGLTTDEDGGEAEFSLHLATEPTDEVTITFDSSNTGEGTVDPAFVIFGPGDGKWNKNKYVTVIGVDDPLVDAHIVYTIITGRPMSTSDVDYPNVDVDDVEVTNLNKDMPMTPVPRGPEVVMCFNPAPEECPLDRANYNDHFCDFEANYLAAVLEAFVSDLELVNLNTSAPSRILDIDNGRCREMNICGGDGACALHVALRGEAVISGFNDRAQGILKDCAEFPRYCLKLEGLGLVRPPTRPTMLTPVTKAPEEEEPFPIYLVIAAAVLLVLVCAVGAYFCVTRGKQSDVSHVMHADYLPVIEVSCDKSGNDSDAFSSAKPTDTTAESFSPVTTPLIEEPPAETPGCLYDNADGGMSFGQSTWRGKTFNGSLAFTLPVQGGHPLSRSMRSGHSSARTPPSRSHRERSTQHSA